MGRKAKGGWDLRRYGGSDIWYVRFRHKGQDRKLSTGTRDRGEALVEAQRVYERVTTEQDNLRRRNATLVDLVSQWLDDVEPELAVGTWERYEEQWRVHLLPHFGTMSAITPGACDAYVRRRLTQVRAETVKRELSALRRFLDWCVRGGVLAVAPDVRSPPKRALGTDASPKHHVELSREQVLAILAELPERTSKGNPARAFFTVMWETALRYRTLACLEVPKHYRPGKREIAITADIDKARYARTIPITDAAARALNSVLSEGADGLVFGSVDYRTMLHTACLAAGLSEHDARHVGYHEFRHAAAMDLGSRVTDLTALAFLLGHKSVTTTAKYVRGREAGARRALQARESER